MRLNGPTQAVLMAMTLGVSACKAVTQDAASLKTLDQYLGSTRRAELERAEYGQQHENAGFNEALASDVALKKEALEEYNKANPEPAPTPDFEPNLNPYAQTPVGNTVPYDKGYEDQVNYVYNTEPSDPATASDGSSSDGTSSD